MIEQQPQTKMVYVVTDTKGAGRIVGVFDDPKVAEKISAIDPAYFREYHAPLNAVNPIAIEWLLSEWQRTALRDLGEPAS